MTNKNLYKPYHDTLATRNAFEKMIKFADSNNIKILSEYISSEDYIRFMFLNTEFCCIQMNMYRIVNSIKTAIEYINKKDTFMKLKNIKDVPYYIIKTYDGAIIEKNFSSYKKFIKGRKVFYDLLDKNNHVNLTPYTDNHSKVLIDFKCKIHKPDYKSVVGYKHDCGCPNCSKRVVTIGINDMATTAPEMIKYLHNKDDAFLYSKGSTKKILFECPNCHTLKTDSPANVNYFGFSCPSCSDGISYPNKFMYHCLKQLNIKFDVEKQFEWCKFPNIKNKNATNVGRYDFVIPNKKIIIEMDGGLGHGNDSLDRTSKENLYIDAMKDKLALENGYNVIRIDCNYGKLSNRKQFIMKNILSSKLNQYYDFNIVDFDKADFDSQQSFVLKIWMLYNEGMDATEISKQIPLSVASISNHLKNGNDLGVLVYNSKTVYENRKNKLKQSIAIPCCMYDILTNQKFYYDSLSACTKEIGVRNISYYVKNDCIYKRRYSFSYISREEFNRIKSETPDKAFGDFFENLISIPRKSA